MTPTPHVRPMSLGSRKVLFGSLIVIFIVLLPVIMFYATGYRFDWTGNARSIVSTGGMYVTAPDGNVEISLNDEPVSDLRVFRSASYIQNLSAGMHSLVVYGDGVQTWTKDLPVFPHIVTEVEAFTMPEIPQVRVITPYLLEGASVVFGHATSSTVVPVLASTTNTFFFATSTRTTEYVSNPEYAYIDALFGTSTATSTSLVDQVVSGMEQTFGFATEERRVVATTTKTEQDVTLFSDGEDVYASWRGELRNRPYYYCIDYESASSTISQYGEHVYASIEAIVASSSSRNVLLQNDRTRVCRDKIKIDRKRQNVLDFDFYPDSTDHVLMLLSDGLYVVEVDDRAWQNMQLLYPGEELRMVVDGGQIFLRDGDVYMEVFTELTE